MLEISRKLISCFNENKVVYCSWKGNDHIDQCLSGIGDIDILVAIKDQNICYKILKELQFLHCKSQFGSRISKVEDWIGFDCKTGTLIHLHLHFSIVAGVSGLMEYDLPWTLKSLNSRVLHPEYSIHMIKPELELITRYVLIALSGNFLSVLKYRIKGFQISSKYNSEIAYLKSQCNINDFIRLVDEFVSYNPNKFVELVFKSDFSGKDYFELRQICKKSFESNRRYSGLKFMAKESSLVISKFARNVIKRFYPESIITHKIPISEKSPIITFMGQDGAGKSTVVKDIRKWLSWKFEVSQFYLGSGEHYLPWEKKMAVRLHNTNNLIAKLFRKWLPFSYLSRLSQNVLETIVRANKYANKGGIVLFDRYPQIEFWGINDGPKIRYTIMKSANNVFLRTIANYYAKKEEKNIYQAVRYTPDIVFKLMLTPEESIRRKPHENFELVKKKHEIIKSLKFDNSAVYIVDATQDYEAEIIEIKNIIWSHLIK